MLKWYEVAAADAPVPDAIRTLARGALEDASAAWELELSADIGFVILHRCGHDFYFLLICTWRNQNEVWETVWAKDGDADAAFRPWRDRRAAPAHLTASGSSASSATRRARGPATCAPPVIRRPAGPTSKTASTGRCDPVSGSGRFPITGGSRIGRSTSW